MNKALKNLSVEFAHLGITFEQDDTLIYAYLNRGSVFNENSKPFLVIQYANLYGQSWLPKALKQLSLDLSYGIRTATEEELAEYDYNNG
jgi:hypothetical protein